METYYFHTEDGQFCHDDDGAELRNIEAAKAEAVQLMVETLHRSPAKLWDTGAFKVIVTDERGLTLFSVSVDATLAPILRR